MIFAYRVLGFFLYPFLLLFLYWRVVLKKEDPKRFKEKIFVSNFNVNKKDSSKLIWIHAASIGEYKSIMPIIKKLDHDKKNLEFLITTSTFSSGKLAETELKSFKNINHRYFPFDINFLIKNFLNLWKPEKIFLVDSEIWPNLILQAKKMNISLAIINARLTAKSFKKWIIFPKTAKKIFNVFDLCLCSNKKTKSYLETLSAKNIKYIGNIKLINLTKIEKISNLNSEIIMKKRSWVAASTHEDEHIFCLNTHKELKKKYRDVMTIIAPRHIDRVEKIKSLYLSQNFKTQILNLNDKILDDSEVIIINSFGNLQSYFKFVKSVFMGKSTVRKLKFDSGQNPIEAAKLNCKIYHGPYVSNFEELYQILKENKISQKILDYEELAKNLTLDLEKSYEKKNINVNSIEKLSNKVLANTINSVNKFLNNDFQ